MIRYTSQHQLSIGEFKTPFEQSLLPTNRWVLLSSALPWDDLAQVYHRQMSAGMGRGSINTRLVIGVLIIKHILKLDDREVLATLQENVYLQYFVGFSSFQTKIAFDPSLLVTLRKRMGLEAFDEWSQAVIKKIEAIESAQIEPRKDLEVSNNIAIKSNINQDEAPTQTSDSVKTETKIVQANTPIELKDTLIIDTTVAEQKIKYPTDIDLLNNVREFTEELIDIFYEASALKIKPRTYRNIARKDYLNAALKRKKSSKEVRKAIKKQLSYIERNIFTINTLWDMLVGNNSPILFANPKHKALYKKWLVCQEIYRQQREMIDRNVKFCDNRIVSIDQPHVRPILRGKASKNIEFGSKVALSVVNGTNRIYRISWNAYNDGVDLIGQVEAYKKQYNQYPKLVLADEIYMTKVNRAFLKENNIEHRGKPLGRPKKDENGNKINPYNAFQQQQANQRNHVEGQFGTAKDAYDLNKVKAKTTETSESWIANIFFILNINRLLKIVQKAMPNILGSFLKTLKSAFFTIFNAWEFRKKLQYA